MNKPKTTHELYWLMPEPRYLKPRARKPKSEMELKRRAYNDRRNELRRAARARARFGSAGS
jgi:hypothetical protein